MSQTEGEDFSQRSETGRVGQIKEHLKSFIGIHKEFAEKGYVVRTFYIYYSFVYLIKLTKFTAQRQK